jgi:TolB protein
VTVKLQLNDLPASFGTWRSADLHVHMNYGGHYRNTPEILARQARAEDLDVVYNLIVNKEERVPDVGYFRPGPDPASGDGVLILQSQEYHTSYWGHLGLLGLGDHYLTPGFAAYQNSPLASPYPHNGVIADLAHAQGALVGYVHPFDTDIDPLRENVLTNEFPPTWPTAKSTTWRSSASPTISRQPTSRGTPSDPEPVMTFCHFCHE